MKNYIILLLIVAISSVSCSENNTEAPIIEPAGGAHYFINNQSDADLNIIFTKTPELGSEIDSSIVLSHHSTKIFEDGIIGRNPKPTNSFSRIDFFRTKNNASAVFTIDPIDNEEWKIIRQNLGDSGYGLTEYEFVITNNDLK